MRALLSLEFVLGKTLYPKLRMIISPNWVVLALPYTLLPLEPF